MTPFVTVVSGLPRSGTSLMMQMLSDGGMPILTDGMRAPDEDNPRGYLEFEAVRRTAADASWVRQAPGKVVKVIYALLVDLPGEFEYRVIMMHRRVEEAVSSQQKMLRRLGKEGAGVSAEELAELLRADLAKVEEGISRQPNFQSLVVEYAECMSDPLAVSRRVAAFLNMELNLERMVRAVDPALYRTRA